jgi:DNA-binding response OmpR family regulator
MEKERNITILLVDDETRLRQALARTLAIRGYRVEEAATHAEALAAALDHGPDLLLVDINLPDATGWDVLRDLSAADRVFPAIVFSAVPPSARRVREFRPVGVLQKPFPVEALIRLVENAAPRPAPTP